METNLQELISEQSKIREDFRQYLRDDGKAARTVQSYVTDVFPNLAEKPSHRQPSALHRMPRERASQHPNKGC